MWHGFRSSRILKLADLVEYQAALFAFDLNTKTLPIPFNDMFTFNIDLPNARVTRQSYHLYVTKSYNIFASRLPLISIPEIWNTWMNALTYKTTQRHFKYQLKTQIFDAYPERVKCYNLRCNDFYRWIQVIINPVTSHFISFLW